MKYSPRVESMHRMVSAPLAAGYSVGLFDQIKSAGVVQYAFLVCVFEVVTEEPVYVVASEVNGLATEGGGSHFLGIFDGEVHLNMGSSDAWGDKKKFFLEAMRIVEERFCKGKAGE